MKKKSVWTDINPKAVTTDELFGYLHPATREWKDGERLKHFLQKVLETQIIVKINRDPVPVHSIINS